MDSVLRSDSASARDGGRPALDSLESLSSEVYWADLPKKERIKWMIDEELTVSPAAFKGVFAGLKRLTALHN